MFPEGLAIQPSDNELRTLQKWAQSLYASVGNKGGPWPEGTQPQVGDNEDRLESKIAKMLN